MKEHELKSLILEKYGSVAAFSKVVDIPHSTVHSILERGVLNANVNNIFKICRLLGIKPEDLAKDFDFSVNTFNNSVNVSENSGSITYNNNTIEETNPADANLDNIIEGQLTNEEGLKVVAKLLSEILETNKAILEELRRK